MISKPVPKPSKPPPNVLREVLIRRFSEELTLDRKGRLRINSTPELVVTNLKNSDLSIGLAIATHAPEWDTCMKAFKRLGYLH